MERSLKGQTGASNAQIARWKELRWRCRTDLLFLTNKILYPEFEENIPIQAPICNLLQSFPLPTEYDMVAERVTPAGCYFHRPNKAKKLLPGPRRRLLLDFRSSGKSTVNARCHTIQWLLNFPDIALLLVQSNISKAEDLLESVRSHFQYNNLFREIFPDYCPQGRRVADWGNRERFTLPNRQDRHRAEPSVMAVSIEKSTQGYHFDVIKHSDIVGPDNIKTTDQIENIKKMFGMYKKLLVDLDDWIDVEGTRYHFADLYGKIIEDHQTSPIEMREWQIHCRGCYKKDTKGHPYTFQPEEMDLPYLLDKDGKFISWWPERFPTFELEKERRTDDDMFATQMLNNPNDLSQSERPFDLKYYTEITPEDFRKVPIAYREITVDTAETTGKRSDYTAITVCAVDGAGRRYVEDIEHGKFNPDEIVDNLFAMYMRYKPTHIKIEETGFVRALKSTVLRHQSKLGIYPNFQFLPRDNQNSKTERIMSLQPWYKHGEIKFLGNLRAKDALKKELNQFPKCAHDDILDTLADQFQGKDWFGREKTRMDPAEANRRALAGKYKIGVPGIDFDEDEEGVNDPHFSRVGY